MDNKRRPFSAFLTKRRQAENPICAITAPFKVSLASPQELLRFKPARDFMHLMRPYTEHSRTSPQHSDYLRSGSVIPQQTYTKTTHRPIDPRLQASEDAFLIYSRPANPTNTSFKSSPSDQNCRITSTGLRRTRQDDPGVIFPANDLPKRPSTKYLSNVTKIVSVEALQKLDQENAALKSRLLRSSTEACLSLDRLQSPRAQSKSRLMSRTKDSITNSFGYARPSTTQTVNQGPRFLNTRSSWRSIKTAPDQVRLRSSQTTRRSFKGL